MKMSFINFYFAFNLYVVVKVRHYYYSAYVLPQKLAPSKIEGSMKHSELREGEEIQKQNNAN